MKKRPLFCCAVVLILWICIDFFFHSEKDTSFLGREGQNILCEGIIDKMEYKSDGQLQIELVHVQSEFLDAVARSDKVQVILKEPARCALGNRVRVQGKQSGLDIPSNDGQFDRLFYQKSNKILFTIKQAKLLVLDDHTYPIRQFLFLTRNQCRQKFLQVFQQEDAGVLAAMLLGDKTELTDEIKDWYQLGGISHILAISGLHISMFGMAFYRFFRRCGIPFFACMAVSGSILFLYVLFTGAAVSSVRAFLMFLIFLMAQCLGRTYDLLCALACAVLFLLLSNPLLVFTSGFQMSVLAVAAIGGVYPLMKKSFGRMVSAGLCIQLVMLPCFLWHTFTFSVYSILLNLIVIPLLPFILTGGVAVLITSFLFVPAATAMASVVHRLLWIYQVLCKIAASMPFALWNAGKPEVWAVLLYYLLVIGGLYVFASKKQKTAYFLLVISAMLLLGRKEKADFSITFLDVGQGDGICIQNSEHRAMLCDGGSSSVQKTGRYRILPFLKYHGISQLDYIFLTHMDADHINGIRELLEMEVPWVKIKNLVLPDLSAPDDTYLEIEALAKEKGIFVQKMQTGDQVRAGELVITCLAPEKGSISTNKNELSLVLHVKYRTFDAMLMGDMEKDGEKKLVRSGNLKLFQEGKNKLEVLKAGHHGSKGATSEELLELLKPELTVLSYGKGNRYGHPSEETMNRLKKAKCSSISTEKYGEITISYQKNEKMIVRYGKNVIK